MNFETYNKQRTEQSLDELFKRYLPDTLYMSHYELSKIHGHTPQEWRTYLRDNHLFIETELAAIAEAEARAALSRLSNATGTEVQALKTLLEKSKLINDAQRQNTRVLLTYINPTDRDKKEDLKSPQRSELENSPNNSTDFKR